MSSSSSSSNSDDDSGEVRRGPWTLHEDSLLIHSISLHGEGRWNLLSKHAGLRRTGKSCRLRWLNYLKPDVKRGNLSAHEQLLILDLHSQWGNRWSKIAQHLPGRTDNEIKNYWRTRVQKQAKHLKVDANSPAFKEIITRFWIPRLLQDIHASTSNSSLPVSCCPPQPPPLQEVDHDQYSDHSDLGSAINISQLQQYHAIMDCDDTGVTNYCSCLKDCYDVDRSTCLCDIERVSGDQPVGDSDLGDNNIMWSMDEFIYENIVTS